jgi:hypothetical protein
MRGRPRFRARSPARIITSPPAYGTKAKRKGTTAAIPGTRSRRRNTSSGTGRKERTLVYDSAVVACSCGPAKVSSHRPIVFRKPRAVTAEPTVIPTTSVNTRTVTDVRPGARRSPSAARRSASERSGAPARTIRRVHRAAAGTIPPAARVNRTVIACPAYPGRREGRR